MSTPPPLRSKRPVSTVSGLSKPRWYRSQISGPKSVFSSSGAKPPKKPPDVGDVAQQHALGVVVAGRVDRLRQVDDDRAVLAQQDVELGEVAVHDPGAQHPHHLHQQEGMVGPRLVGLQRHVVQARSGVAVFVGHQLHQQHAVVEVVGPGHPHVGGRQPVERIDLGALPGRLLGLAPELRALGHGACLAACS